MRDKKVSSILKVSERATNNGVPQTEIYKSIDSDNFLPPLERQQPSQNSSEASEGAESQHSEDNKQPTSAKTKENGSTKMVQEDNATNDGAEEQMLKSDDNGQLTEKREEVKFIKGDHQNGDAKIDIGGIGGQTFTGMTKEELMKYANDPFWVRLRWICFIAFWLIWIAMLVGAIWIIIGAPKCAAPEPLPWYKRGLLAVFGKFDADPNDLALAKKLKASGTVYEMPAELTYSVRDPDVEQKIKNIVGVYKDSGINVVLDITPNYVSPESHIFKDALADESKRSSFLWIEKSSVPSNWLSRVNGSAWAEVQPNNYVLSQFGDNLYDLQMNDTNVKSDLINNLKRLMELGIKGFRLKNTKYYLLSKNIRDEVVSDDPKYVHTEYGFWSHAQTSFQDGLGDLLYDYAAALKNISADAYLSVPKDITRPEVYRTSTGGFGIDTPMYGRFVNTLSAPQNKNLVNELLKTMDSVGNGTWMQWSFADVANDTKVDPSALGLFMFLLPGVPAVSVDSELFKNISESTYAHIEQLRSSPSYMHGTLDLYAADDLVAYSRIKSGNPGYFVVFNPAEGIRTGNFTNPELPQKMTVDSMSENYNITGISVKSKIMTDSVELSPYSTIILTYVPVKSG